MQNGIDDREDAGVAQVAMSELLCKTRTAAGGFAGLFDANLRLLRDFLAYLNARSKVRGGTEEFQILFRRFLVATEGRRCLRLINGAGSEPSLGANWVTVDLHKLEQTSQESGFTSLDLSSGCFDSVLCTGLESVSQPRALIGEMLRVLRTNGQVWVQVPLMAPYCPPSEGAVSEYWRITPDGLRVLLRDFDEILCSVYSPGWNSIRSCSFYYGLKGEEEPEQVSLDELQAVLEIAIPGH